MVLTKRVFFYTNIFLRSSKSEEGGGEGVRAGGREGGRAGGREGVRG